MIHTFVTLKLDCHVDSAPRHDESCHHERMRSDPSLFAEREGFTLYTPVPDFDANLY